MLKRLSKFAEGVREHWESRTLALIVSYLIWLFVEGIALVLGDWERVVDVRGHRAIIYKDAGQLQIALRLMDSCLQIVETRFPSRSDLWQIYASEVANILVRLNRNRAELEKAFALARKAALLALENARHDYLRRMTLLAKAETALDRFRTPEELPSWDTDFLSPRTRMHFESAVSLARDPSEPVADPSHRVGALIAAAQFYWEYFSQGSEDEEEIFELLDEAEKIARENGLTRRLEEINTLRWEWKEHVGS
jgi:hypothetical protein